MSNFLPIHNSRAVAKMDVPVIPFDDFREEVVSACFSDGRLVALFGAPENNSLRLYAVIAPSEGGLCVGAADVGSEYESLTTDCLQAHLFEREIAEQWNVIPTGHPWLKPVRGIGGTRSIASSENNSNAGTYPATADFYRVEGDEVHEVAVGPVHAGIIEPGHFRFQCHGESVFSLEIALGYQHRGVERALIGGPNARTAHYMETLAGDTSIGHSLAHAQTVEGLSGFVPPARAQALRGVALELERIANHTGDLGALAGDVGYLPTSSFCGRLRGDVLNMTALACGSRFGRGWVRPGGVAFDLDEKRTVEMAHKMRAAFRDIHGAVNMLWNNSSVMARFEETGPLTKELCAELGLVGPAARACGIERDVRYEFPCGIYRFAHIPVSTWPSGDVFARAYVRWLEICHAKDFILAQLESPAESGTFMPVGDIKPDSLVVSLVEGWRGEVCHVAITGHDSKFSAYKVVDPSFHNWTGLAMALRNQQISDFPLCNKSFNLSYCGHDL